MDKEKVLWYIRQFQILRAGFVHEAVDIELSEHHVINFEQHMDDALLDVSGVYNDLVWMEIEQRKEAKHVQG